MFTLIYRKQEYHYTAGLSVAQALEKLDLSPETHLVVRAGLLLKPDDILNDGDVIKVIAAFAGGGQ